MPGVVETWRELRHDAVGRLNGSKYNLSGTAGGTIVENLNSVKYDALGRRVNVCDQSLCSIEGYDGTNVTRTSGGWRFVHGPGLDDPLVGVFGTTRYFFFTDGAGRHIVTTDTAGVNAGAAGAMAAGATDRAHTFAANRGAAAGGMFSGLSFFRNRYYDQATGRWTQEDPIGPAGGINLYQYAGNNPVSFGDPFGLSADTTYVACRPVGGDNRSEEPSSEYGHCAVRVVDSERGIDAMAEITRNDEGRGWPTMKVGAFAGSSEQVARYGGRWVAVAVPDGMSARAFDNAVVREISAQSRFYDGAPYWPGGHGNSNSFVYRVITGAGGAVPPAASAHIPKVPGICGGRGLNAGTNCVP